MTGGERAVRALWGELTAEGHVSGDYAGQPAAPWPIRLLMGIAGWLGALFFQIFVLASVFLSARENGAIVGACGIALIGLAALLYRRKAGHTASEQFALASSLAGQALALYGAAQMLGGEVVLQRPVFWAAVVVLQIALYALIANRLHRFIVALFALMAAAAGISVALAPAEYFAWSSVLTMALSWLAPGAGLLVTVFVLAEAALCEAGRHGRFEPAADAGLCFTLGAALLLTGAGHPLAMVWSPGEGAAGQAHWIAGALIGVVLTGSSWAETRRLGLPLAWSMVAALCAAVFSALLAGAPAVTAGVLALGLALRRGSLPWLGLAIATIGIGFIWYYSALHWTLLIKSATLVAAGVAVLAMRLWLLRSRTVELAS
jgi:hypothetical protein